MTQHSFSIEFFPPKTPEGAEKLRVARRTLAEIRPEYFSVTFGAGGSNRRSSLDVLRFIKEHTHVEALAHLTCVGTTHAEAAAIVREFLEAGITSFLALRGDPPTDEAHVSEFMGDIKSASELVQLIANVQSERVPWTESHAPGNDRGRILDPTPGRVTIAVAAFPNGHPESGSTRRDIDSLLAKLIAHSPSPRFDDVVAVDGDACLAERCCLSRGALAIGAVAVVASDLLALTLERTFGSENFFSEMLGCVALRRGEAAGRGRLRRSRRKRGPATIAEPASGL